MQKSYQQLPLKNINNMWTVWTVDMCPHPPLAMHPYAFWITFTMNMA